MRIIELTSVTCWSRCRSISTQKSSKLFRCSQRIGLAFSGLPLFCFFCYSSLNSTRARFEKGRLRRQRCPSFARRTYGLNREKSRWRCVSLVCPPSGEQTKLWVDRGRSGGTRNVVLQSSSRWCRCVVTIVNVVVVFEESSSHFTPEDIWINRMRWSAGPTVEERKLSQENDLPS